MKEFRGTVMVDLDGVLFDFAGRFREWLSGKHFREYNTPTRWHFYEDWGFTAEEFLVLLDQFARERKFIQPPIDGAIAFVRGLKDLGMRVVLCTHRTTEAADDTMQWAQFYFPEADDVVIISDGSSKSVFMDYGPSPYFAIDDKPETVVDLADRGVWAMLHDAPWNHYFSVMTTTRVIRTLSFKQALEHVESRVLVAERENGVAEARRLEAGRKVAPSKRAVQECAITSEPQQQDALVQAEEGASIGPFVFRDGKWQWANGNPVQGYFEKPTDDGEVTYVDPTTGGKKGAKPDRFDLLPTEPLRIVARHYGIGAVKYGDRNWEKGYPWSLTYAAMQRHLNAFWAGEDLDPETQSPHLAAVVFHAFALLEFMNTHPEMDDRPKKENNV